MQLQLNEITDYDYPNHYYIDRTFLGTIHFTFPL